MYSKKKKGTRLDSVQEVYSYKDQQSPTMISKGSRAQGKAALHIQEKTKQKTRINGMGYILA